MKALVSVIALILFFVYIPLSAYQTFLLYQHVHATELMWFLYWVNLPIILISSVVGQAMKSVKD